MVTKNRNLTYYHGYPFGELYDLEDDPGEIRNRWLDAEYAKDIERLLTHLLDHAEALERREERGRG